MMKIAVIGGGIFGISAALKLSSKNDVTLFEKNNQLLKGASGSNQYRVHRGYHYPRSPDTVTGILKSEQSFQNFFSRALINYNEHFYCIAKKKSLTTREQFIKFLHDNKLEFFESKINLVNSNKIDLCIKVKESLYDPEILKKICLEKLERSTVKLKLNFNATKKIFDNYDKVIIATYSKINELLDDFNEHTNDYQFEICEKPLVKLPLIFKNKSIVIMDGPFMCIDPLSNTNFHLLCNVKHEIHSSNIGTTPHVDKKFYPYLDNGLIKNPNITNFDKFIKSGIEFFPELKHAKHLGSFFTIRAVPPREEKTDSRPTIVSSINDKIKVIFSGKITTCIDAASQVEKIIMENEEC